MLQINNKGLRWGVRLVALFACFASIAMVFMFSTKLNHDNYRLLYSQTERLSRIVVRQAAQNAYDAILNKNDKVLEQIVVNLDKEEFIFDVNIYDRNGSLLYSSKSALALSELTGLNTPLSIASIGRHQLVEPITQNGKYVGFLRITLEHGKIVKLASNGLNTNINFIHSMLILALFTGAILILSLSKRIEFWLAPFLAR